MQAKHVCISGDFVKDDQFHKLVISGEGANQYSINFEMVRCLYFLPCIQDELVCDDLLTSLLSIDKE